MNNINRTQQIPVAFNMEKAMTYGSAIKSSANRNIALNNLNRMSMATNPWIRKTAQGVLSNNYVDYQNQLVEQASGTGAQQEYYREALGQIRNRARPTSMGERLSQAVQTNEDPLFDLGSQFWTDIGYKGGSSFSGSSVSGSSVSGGESYLSEGELNVGGYLQEPEQAGAFDLASLLQQGKEARRMREARYQTVGGGAMPGGWRSELNLEQGVAVEEASAILMARALREDPFVLSADLPREFGGGEAVGGFTQGRGGLISRKMFEEAERQQAFARQETLRGQNPLELISLFTQDVKSEVENLGEYEREALEQGVEQDFSTPDITLRRRKNRFADMRSNQQQTLPNPVSSMFQMEEYERGFNYSELGRRAGLPDFEFQASGAGEAGGYASRENFGNLGEMPTFEQIRLVYQPPEGTSEEQTIAYAEFIERNLRGYGRIPTDPWQSFLASYRSSFL